MLKRLFRPEILILAGLAAAGLVAVSMKEADGKYEQPEYTVLKTYPDGVEIRLYAPRIAAEVRVSGTKEQALKQGFKILAGYIFGDNKSRQKVAMTAPAVASEGSSNGNPPSKSEKVSMTSPVTASESDGKWTVRFFMPSKYSLGTLPIPNNGDIAFKELPAETFAALRFSGTWSEEKFRRHTDQLSERLRAHQIVQEHGAAISAYYNPPFTPPFMRRNEVMYPVRSQSVEALPGS